jgi:hypothetical protein
MSYLSDYVFYSSGNETPEEYLWWGGLSLLGHILNKKVWVKHGGYFRFYPNLYVCLVGDAGSGKNTALSVNMNIMIKHFPTLLLSSSIQSREDIALQMSDDNLCLQTYQDETNHIIGYRPFYILNNELASFLSVDKIRMVEFLTEVYDGERFSTGFKKDRVENPTKKQWFDNPHVSLLAGAVPSWFMGSLKLDLFAGGLGRRMIIVNAQRTKIVADPQKPEGADAALIRVIEHLKLAHKFQGELLRTPDAMKWWLEWYEKHKRQDPIDPILNQFHQTKPMQVLKIAMLLRCTELPLGYDIESHHLAAAVELLTKLEPSILRLTSGIGRNELAGVGAEIIDFIIRMGGMVSEVNLRKHFSRYLRMPEFQEIENHYMMTQELMIATATDDNNVNRKFYFTPEGYKKYEEARRSKQK